MTASEWAAKWNSLTPNGQLWMEFWEDYQLRFPHDVEASNLATGYAGSNTYYFVPHANLDISQGLMSSRGGVVVYIADHLRGSTEPPQSVRSRAAEYRAVLRDSLIDPGLPWNGWFQTDVYDRSTWPETADWLHESVAVWRRVMRQYADAELV